MSTWQVQTAKAKFSELLRAVREHGPQIISVRGKDEFVIQLASEALPVERPTTGLDLFRPVLGLGVKLELPPRNPDEDRVRSLFEEEEDYDDGSNP